MTTTVNPAPPRLRGRKDVTAWLRQRPPLGEVRAAFPAEWELVERELIGIMASGDVGRIRDRLTALTRPVRSTSGHARPEHELRSQMIRRYLTVEALRQAWVRAESGADGARLQFGLFNGLVLQQLLFRRGLRRKPVALLPFRLVWPLLTQRRYLMPLVVPQGIYCFYSRRLIKALTGLSGPRSCLEIAAVYLFHRREPAPASTS